MRKKVLSVIAVLCLMAGTVVPLAAEYHVDVGTEFYPANGYFSISKSAPGCLINTGVGLYDVSGNLLTYDEDEAYDYCFSEAQHPDAVEAHWDWHYWD